MNPAAQKETELNENILKVREDAEPVRFMMSGSGAQVTSSEIPPWARNNFDRVALRSRIEPWLTSLVQADHLNLLVGAGLTRGIQQIAGADSPASMGTGKFNTYNREIAEAANKSAKNAGRDIPNIEDEIRTANQLLRGLEILEDKSQSVLADELTQIMSSFSQSILQGESNLVRSEPGARDEAFTVLISFLMSFSSRTGTRDRLGLFTTNYDRLVEVGAELAGMHLIDRFVGSVSPVFRSSRLDLDLHYNPLGIRGEPRFVEGVVRYTKLHGSLDWIDTGSVIRRVGVPFGASTLDPYLEVPGSCDPDPRRLMIYPNASKDRETAEFPYVELFRDFAAAVARPNAVTVTYGYSFGDEHINRVLQDALTIPSTHLVIIAYGDELGRIKRAFDTWGHKSQMTLLIGPELADLGTLTAHYLPKPSIDLASRRMGELLRQRLGEATEPRSVNRDESGEV